MGLEKYKVGDEEEGGYFEFGIVLRFMYWFLFCFGFRAVLRQPLHVGWMYLLNDIKLMAISIVNDHMRFNSKNIVWPRGRSRRVVCRNSGHLVLVKGLPCDPRGIKGLASRCSRTLGTVMYC